MDNHDSSYLFKAAKRRLDTYPPGTTTYSDEVRAGGSYDTTVEGVNAFRHPLVEHMIVDFLMEHGVSLPQAYTYTRLLWMANTNLDYPVTIANLAKQTHRTRQTVTEQIKALERRGIIEREYQARGPMIWRFRMWMDLERHLSGAEAEVVEAR